MKSVFIFLFTLFTAFIQPAEAKTLPVANNALQSFYNTYGKKTEASWIEFDGIYKASFKYNDHQIMAYYNEEGENIATARYISCQELPVDLQIALKQKTTTFITEEIFQVTNEQGTHYFVTLANSKERIVFKENGKSWKVFKRSAIM